MAAVLAAAAAFALQGCGGGASIRTGALPDSVEVIARGNEPFWGVAISRQGIVFREPENIDGIAFPYAAPAVTGGRRTFRAIPATGPGIEVVIEKKPCNDGMSGEKYDYAATVTIGGRHLQGCALERRAGVMGIDRRWLLDAELPEDPPATGTFRLSYGAYEDTARRLSVKLIATAEGDLDGDGRRDAAAVTATNLGGSGVFIAVTAMVNRWGRPVAVARAPLGDRIKLDTLYVADRTIVARYEEHGPSDAMCCPTQPALKRLAIRGDRLEEVH